MFIKTVGLHSCEKKTIQIEHSPENKINKLIKFLFIIKLYKNSILMHAIIYLIKHKYLKNLDQCYSLTTAVKLQNSTVGMIVFII
jgi:hypothetical protein